MAESPGSYLVKTSFIGLDDKEIQVDVKNENIDLEVIELVVSGVELETAVVTARRALVEVKADRTVFNVEGTINSAGENVIGLLRKAPGVLVDNNNNISVLGRSGVLVYVDGKRLPITGDDLTNYLQSIPSERIDRIDIISSPGAKYEAEGNAGIIDIRLKKNQNVGTNGTISAAYSVGRFANYNATLSGNRRTDNFNWYGSIGVQDNNPFNDMLFRSDQNGIFLTESVYGKNDIRGLDGRLGVDYYVSENSTIGVLYSGGINVRDESLSNRIEISPANSNELIDSILITRNLSDRDFDRNSFNLNYAYNTKSKTFNADVDYGRYRRESFNDQPNFYYDPTETFIVSQNLTYYETPSDIDIYTAKVDYEQDAFGGRLGLGSKFSKVVTDNTFLFYDANGETNQLVNNRSNNFEYDENVTAAYANFSKSLNQKWSYNAGLRVEYTDATGDLTAFDPDLQEPAVILEYVNYFPNLGISYNYKPSHSFNLNYGRRINRPDYNVLNPFREQLSELSYARGNPFLNPEIVNNIELGYTYAYRYNFKISYSRTTDQITRLIGPDSEDPRSSFIGWDNLTNQDVYGFNMALPFQFKSWWNAFFNIGASYLDNQADYGDGAIVDVQAFNYTLYSQQTFNLPGDFVGEISGWFSGPGIWGGVFKYDESYSLNLGLQRKFLEKKLNVKLAASDIMLQSGWSGSSFFDGLNSWGRGFWDSRRVSLSASYNFGNNKIKGRNRSTGLDDESKRLGS